jgi:hypothetical protein
MVLRRLSLVLWPALVLLAAGANDPRPLGTSKGPDPVDWACTDCGNTVKNMPPPAPKCRKCSGGAMKQVKK